MSRNKVVQTILTVVILMSAILLPYSNAQGQETPEAIDARRRIEWNIKWQQDVIGSELMDTISTVTADPEMQVYQVYSFRYLHSSSGITKTLTPSTTPTRISSGNHIYSVGNIAYYTSLGGKAFMGSAHSTLCSEAGSNQVGPELRVTRTSDSVTWTGFSNLTDQDLVVSINDNGVISTQDAAPGKGVQVPVSDVGEIRVSKPDGEICAWLWWNWNQLLPEKGVVTISAEQTAWKVGDGNELAILIEGIEEEPLTDFQFAVSYDKDKATFDGIEQEGTLAQNWTIETNTQEGYVKIVAAAGTTISSAGTLVKLKFTGKTAGNTYIRFEDNTFLLNDGELFVGNIDSSISIGTFKIEGTALYGKSDDTRIGIPRMHVVLTGNSFDEIYTNEEGQYVLTASNGGDHLVGFNKNRHEDTNNSIKVSAVSKVLRCAAGTDTCLNITSDVNDKNGVNAHDAFLIGQGILGNFPEESHVGEWRCRVPFVMVTITQDILNADITCYIVGDSTQAWSPEAIVAASSMPAVSFGEMAREGNYVHIPIVISSPHSDGAKFTLNVEGGELVDVLAEGWGVVNSGNTYLVSGTGFTDNLTVIATVKTSGKSTLTVENLQVANIPEIQGEVARTNVLPLVLEYYFPIAMK